MTFGVVFLAAYVAVGDGYDQVDERIEWILFKTIHVLDERVSVRARHDREVSVYHAQWQIVHMLVKSQEKN